MAKTNWQDPQTSEIRSTHIAGLMDAVGKIEDVLDLKLQAETNVPLTEVYISELDRYRIYQAPAGKRNWASSPSPVIKKNGVVISSGFWIDYGGGAIIMSPSATDTDVFTADVSYTKTADNALARHKADTTSAHGIDNKANKGAGSILEATLVNGWAGELYYSKTDIDLVLLWGTVIPGTLTKNTIMSTLPSGYRPVRDNAILVFVPYLGKASIGFVIERTTGNLTVYDNTGMEESRPANFSVVYQGV